MPKKQQPKRHELTDLIGKTIRSVSIYGEPVKGKVVNVLENTIIINDGKEAYVVHIESLDSRYKRGHSGHLYKPRSEHFNLKACQTIGRGASVLIDGHYYW